MLDFLGSRAQTELIGLPCEPPRRDQKALGLLLEALIQPPAVSPKPALVARCYARPSRETRPVEGRFFCRSLMGEQISPARQRVLADRHPLNQRDDTFVCSLTAARETDARCHKHWPNQE